MDLLCHFLSALILLTVGYIYGVTTKINYSQNYTPSQICERLLTDPRQSELEACVEKWRK